MSRTLYVNIGEKNPVITNNISPQGLNDVEGVNLLNLNI